MSRATRKTAYEKAQAIIELFLVYDLIKHVWDSETEAKMWKDISDLYQRRKLLELSAARHKFYTATMDTSESVFLFIYRVRQLAVDVESMVVQMPDQEVALKVLCRLPTKFEHFVVVIDAFANNDMIS